MPSSLRTIPGTAIVTIDGVHLRARAIGDVRDTHAPVLVFLHEALGSIAQWKSFPDELCAATGRAGLVYERQGHGGSDPFTGERSMDFYRDEAGRVLPAILRAHGISSYVLVGHSDGATIALQHAASMPEAPRAVVSIAAHVIIEDRTVAGIRDATHAWEHTDFRAKLMRYHGANTDRVFRLWADTWLHPDAASWHMLDELGAITCPVLLMQGEEDSYGTKAQIDHIAARVRGPREICMIPHCGHIPMNEARPHTIQTIHAFINRHAAD